MSSSVRPTWDSAGISEILRAHQLRKFGVECVCKQGCVVDVDRRDYSAIEAVHQAAELLAAFANAAQAIGETP